MIILRGCGHIGKWVQENIIFMRFCWHFKLSKKTEKLLNEPLTHAIAYLSTHTVYQHKIQFLHYFRGIWPYWKMDTGKHHFHEILLLFKLSKKTEKLLNEQPVNAITKCTLAGLLQ